MHVWFEFISFPSNDLFMIPQKKEWNHVSRKSVSASEENDDATKLAQEYTMVENRLLLFQE